MTEFLRILTKAIRDRSCLRLVLSQPVAGESDSIEKLIIRPVVVRDEPQYQLALRRDGKETHENLAPDATVERVCELFGTSFAHCHLFATDADYSARTTPGGEITFSKSRPTGQPTDASHDRRKNYLIPDNVPCPFLHAIGVMTKAGQVRAAKQQKFRQINRFLELVDDVTRNLPADGPLNVVDFGCGKSTRHGSYF